MDVDGCNNVDTVRQVNEFQVFFHSIPAETNDFALSPILKLNEESFSVIFSFFIVHGMIFLLHFSSSIDFLIEIQPFFIDNKKREFENFTIDVIEKKM